MNNVAFKLLVDELQNNFSEEKINKYIENLTNLRNSDKIYAYGKVYLAAHLSDSSELGLGMKQGKVIDKTEQYIDDHKDEIIAERNSEIDHTIKALKWMQKMTSKLDETDLFGSIETIRNHFRSLYKEAYEHNLDKTEDIEQAIAQKDELYYFLKPGVLGGPEYDDQVIYKFLDEMFDTAETSLMDLENNSYLTALDRCVTAITAADPGVGIKTSSDNGNALNTIKELAHYNGETDIEEKIQAEKRPANKLRLEVIRKAMKSYPAPYTAVKDIDPAAEEVQISRDFFLNLKAEPKIHSPEMTALLRDLNSYRDSYDIGYGMLPGSDTETKFHKILKEIELIRKKSAKIKPKDFHETEMFLQSAEAYSEKMLYLKTLQKVNTEHNDPITADQNRIVAEQIVIRTRNTMDRLAERLNQYSSGNQSTEFSKIYQALEALQSKTACDTRELQEQLIRAKNAADEYIRAKDRYRFEGSRSTNKGQARYDTVRNISSMCETFIDMIARSNEIGCQVFLNYYRTYSDREDKMSYISQHNVSKPDELSDFRMPKEYYLHKANRNLRHMQENCEKYTAENTSDDAAKSARTNYNYSFLAYLKNMDLAENKQLRDQMDFSSDDCHQQFQQLELLSAGAKDVFNYTKIFLQHGNRNGLVEMKNGAEKVMVDQNRMLPNLLQIDYIDMLRKKVYEQRTVLDNISRLDLQQTNKLLSSTKNSEKIINRFMESLSPILNDEEQRTVDGFREQAKADLKQALENHRNKLMQKENPQDPVKINPALIIDNPPAK